MFNTTDVYFYASYAMAMLWPQLQLSIMKDIELATAKQYEDTRTIIRSGKITMRKQKDAVPHDLGGPGEGS